MKEEFKLKNKAIVFTIIIIVLIIGVVSFVLISSSQDEKNEVAINKNEGGPIAPSKVDSNEKDVNNKKKKELFNFVPKIYTEAIGPFESDFMLDAVMNKIMATDENLDYSTKNVDSLVTKIFGKEAKINKEEVSKPDVQKSLFYYSKEANSYAVIPVGYEGIYEYQILKNVTETEKNYYVYTYTLIGGYSFDEDSITKDEFGDINYESSKVEVVVGNKDGNDLVHVFDNFSKIYEDEIWIENYKNVMPVFRYTLTKDGSSYYLTEVEQLNY